MEQSDKLLQPERLGRILSILEERGTVKVSDLSILCKVSENTIRRDLIELEELGNCSRSKGVATFRQKSQEVTPFSQRLSSHHRSKRAIAKKAAMMVSSGSTVILDSGTTAVELAEELSHKSHITVITPSLEAAVILSGIPEITLILPGGIVNPSSRSLIGQPAEQFFRNIHADILFLAVKAISFDTGLSDHTIIEASVKKEMIKAAEKIVVLADSSKLGKKALSRIAPISIVDTLITDDLSDSEFLNTLRSEGIEIC